MNQRKIVYIPCGVCGYKRKTTLAKAWADKVPKCKNCKNLNRAVRKPKGEYKLYYVKIGDLYKIGITEYENIKHRFIGVDITVIGIWQGSESDIKSTERHLLKSKTIGVLQEDCVLPMGVGYTEMSYKEILNESDIFLLNRTYLSLI